MNWFSFHSQQPPLSDARRTCVCVHAALSSQPAVSPLTGIW